MSFIVHDDVSDVVLDKDGNVNTEKLEKSLRSALDYDIKYKQTDNMKKRACKVAGSYDEFKAMVNCAHLKTVSRQEIESLRAVKKGWKKGGDSSSLSSSNSSSSKQYGGAKWDESSRTPLELGRDFKRLKTLPEQIRYLKFVGVEKVVALFNVDADAELFESILTVILHQHPPTIQSHDTLTKGMEGDDNDGETMNMVSWLTQFHSLTKFDLLYRFLSNEIKQKIVSITNSYPEILDSRKEM